MCGIVFSQHQQVNKAVQTLLHRGPDGNQLADFINHHFGHTRLSIIDLSTGSDQPMVSVSGDSMIIFNGEIYNYQKLRAELNHQGVQFNSNGDTEVILNGIEHQGTSFIQKMDGIFAFIWMNKKTNQLIFSRDVAGKNPLYYSTVDGLSAASEIRTLLKLLPRKATLNSIGLQQYTRYGTIPEPFTLWNEIEMFPAGYIGEWMGTKFKFTQIKFPSSPIIENIKYPQKEIKNTIIQSIEKRLVADVDVGIFLSGGIDSSLITGIVSGELGIKPKTYSVIYEDPNLSEESRIEYVRKKWNLDHTYLRLGNKDILEQIPLSLLAYDHPSIDGVNTFLVSKIVRESGLKVALSGLGGDELFQGYSTFPHARNIQKIQKWMAPFFKLMPYHRSQYLRVFDAITTEDLTQPISSIRSLYPELFIRKIFGNKYSGWHSFISSNDKFHIQDLQGDSKLIALEWHGYMKQMLIRDTNIMSMASSLEVRAPFTDRELYSLILSLPDEVKRPKTQKKQLLVESCKDYLIPEIFTASKMGFVLPMKEWMLGPLQELVLTSLNELHKYPETEALGKFSFAQLNKLKNNQTTWSRVWQWVVLGKVLNDNK